MSWEYIYQFCEEHEAGFRLYCFVMWVAKCADNVQRRQFSIIIAILWYFMLMVLVIPQTILTIQILILIAFLNIFNDINKTPKSNS